MSLDVFDPNVTLNWDLGLSESQTARITGTRDEDGTLNIDRVEFLESGETVNLPPDPDLPDGEEFASTLADLGSDITDYVDENFEYIVRSNEDSFREVCAHLFLISKNSKLQLGKLCWQRLVNALGFMRASESEERNSMVGDWTRKIGCDYYELNNYILAAKAQALVPSVADLTLTAQSEIARNAGESEDEQRETIREREETVRKLDPELKDTTNAVREAKQAEANGNKKLAMYRMRDLSEERVMCDEVVMARINKGEKFDEETGAYEPIYDYVPVMRVFWAEPPSEELRAQTDDIRKILTRRLGVKTQI